MDDKGKKVSKVGAKTSKQRKVSLNKCEYLKYNVSNYRLSKGLNRMKSKRHQKNRKTKKERLRREKT